MFIFVRFWDVSPPPLPKRGAGWAVHVLKSITGGGLKGQLWIGPKVHVTMNCWSLGIANVYVSTRNTDRWWAHCGVCTRNPVTPKSKKQSLINSAKHKATSTSKHISSSSTNISHWYAIIFSLYSSKSLFSNIKSSLFSVSFSAVWSVTHFFWWKPPFCMGSLH